MTNTPQPPAHLQAAGRRLFVDLAVEYGIDDAAGIALLTTAAECLDRTRQAQRAIAKHGVLVKDRYGGRRVAPACKLESDSRAGLLAALKQLNLDLEPLRDRSLPSQRNGNASHATAPPSISTTKPRLVS